MAEKILLINPIKRVSKHSHTKTKRGNTMAKRRTIKKRAHKRTTKRATTVTVRANPIHRIRRRKRHAKRHNPIGRRVTRQQASGVMNHMIMPAVTAASGALVLDFAWSNLPIPAAIKNGNLQFFAKALGAIGMVTVAHKITKNKKQAEAMGVGALTVLLHDMGRNMIKRGAPGLRMGEYVGTGGGLDFDAPLGFYESAAQGANTIQNYPQALPAGGQVVHGFDDGMSEYVMGEYQEDAYDW
jgi:hypothetical protein